jgi:hypothetical protein
MAAHKAKCPRCGADLRTDSDRLICDACGARGVLKSKKSEVDAIRTDPPPDKSIAVAPLLEPINLPEPSPVRPARSAAPWLVLGGAALFCIAGLYCTAYCVAKTLNPSADRSENSDPANPPPEKREDWKQVLAQLREEVAGQPQTGTEETLPEPMSPEVKQAIDKGVAYLKKAMSTPTTTYMNRIGAIALGGLALLECGVPADDPVVQKIAERIRKSSPSLTFTYDVATVIWFLDRLHQPEDREVIRMMALRLISSQGVLGGWGYGSHYLSAQQEKDLMALLNQHRLANVSTVASVAQPVARPDSPVTPIVRPVRPPVAVRVANHLGNLKDLPVFKFKPGERIHGKALDHEDNSLTQFAILALWAVRKYDIPVERSLAMAEARFRTYQNKDGSWGYTINTRARRDSMTCAGLLGLAVARGLVKAENSAREVKDEALEKGLIYVGQAVGKPARKVAGRNKTIGADAWGDLYFLWSLERMAVVWDLKTVAGKDWYAWGSDILVKAQNADGSWSDAFAGIPDTCFALLFLKRVNVVQDLTKQLRLLGKVKDPGNRAPVERLPGEAVKPDDH